MVRVGYFSTYDSRDVNNWSGLGYFIRRSLSEAGLSVEELGPLARPRSAAITAKRVLHRYFLSGSYLPEREALVGRQYARQIEVLLSRTDTDVVFSPGTIPIAYLDVQQPVAFWADATFAALRDFYPDFTDIAKRSIDAGEQMERTALERADLAIYASDWAAASAVEHYGADPAKVEVVPFGANLERDVGPSEVRRLIEARPTDSCRLLFIGLDWERKGGPVAVQVAEELNRAGLPTELTVVGSAPKLPPSTERFVKVEGFVDKRSEEGRRRIHSLLGSSHFLIMPSRAECYGLVLCEANAFGVPCVTTNVGGIPTIVHDGVNGLMFDVDAPPATLAESVLSTLADVDSYRRLALSSYTEYQDRLNWGVSGKRVRSLLERLIELPRFSPTPR
jgi:glycosyltransferase involved in cell wall biosynthesis